MQKFELSMIEDDVSLKEAIAEIIESRKSGLVVQIYGGPLRLVHYDQLLEAEAQGLESLDRVLFEPIIELPDIPDFQIEDLLQAGRSNFGCLGINAGIALMCSLAGEIGSYTTASSGGRCQRPGKPPNVLPRKWYHYYSPIPNPNICRIDHTLIV